MAEAVEMKGRTRLRAPMAAASFLDFSSMCLSQEIRSSTVCAGDSLYAIIFYFDIYVVICIR